MPNLEGIIWRANSPLFYSWWKIYPRTRPFNSLSMMISQLSPLLNAFERVQLNSRKCSLDLGVNIDRWTQLNHRRTSFIDGPPSFYNFRSDSLLLSPYAIHFKAESNYMKINFISRENYTNEKNESQNALSKCYIKS